MVIEQGHQDRNGDPFTIGVVTEGFPQRMGPDPSADSGFPRRMVDDAVGLLPGDRPIVFPRFEQVIGGL